jgi:26S proteasome regulatory subunit N7
MGLFYGDKHLVKKHVERAKTLVETGGDWDRRNRLKAYEGLSLLTTRSYNLAAPLLLDSLSTFTSYELCTYSNLVIYAVLAGSVSLKRVDFKSKVVDAPEIKAILGDGEDKLLALTGAISAGPGADAEMADASAAASSATPSAKVTAVNLTTLGSTTDQPEAEMAVDFGPLAQLVSSLYNGRYKLFFQALALVEEQFLNLDRYLHEHKGWFIREMRLRAYQQLLQSYRVVGLDSMANDFGVTVEFLDRYVIDSTPLFYLAACFANCDVVISPSSSPPAVSPAPLTASRATASSRRTGRTTRTSSTRTWCARATS